MLPLRWASVCVLLGLAIRGGIIAVGKYRRQMQLTVPQDRAPLIVDDVGTVPPARPVRAYLGLFGMTLLNPTTVIYFGALVLGTQAAASVDRLRQLLFVLAAFAASVSWHLVLVSGGALLGRFLSGARGRLLTALAASAVVMFLAVKLLVSR